MNHEEKILALLSELHTGMTDLKTDMSDLKSNVASVKSDIADLKTEVATVKSDVAGLKSEVATVKSDVVGLKSEVATVKSDVAGLKSEFTAVKSDVAILKEEVAAIDQRFAHQLKIVTEADILPKFNLLAEQLEFLEENMVSRAHVDSLSDEVNVLKLMVRQMNERINNLEKAN